MKHNKKNNLDRGVKKMNAVLSLSDIQNRVARNSKRNAEALNRMPDVKSFTRSRPRNSVEEKYLNKFKRK